jgi:cytoskeletal protein CcmA (bactofilin family)
MLKSFMQPGTAGASRNESTRTGHSAYGSSRAGDAARASEAAASEAAKPESAAAKVAEPARNDEGSKLIVGPNIKLKGTEITDCEILVVEGRVEASMNSRDIRIAEGGVFSGKAEIDVAEIRGTFEGELTARKRLVVYATGRVSGTIRYGALMVEEGGTITGNMATHTATPSLTRVPDVATPSAVADDKAAETDAALAGASLVRSLGKRQA